YRDRGARGGPTGNTALGPLPRITGSPVMWIESDSGKGELSHVRAADEYEAGPPQARHGRLVLRSRRAIGERGGSGPGHLSGDIEKVLDGKGDAGVRRGRRAARPQQVYRVSLCEYRTSVDVQEGPAPFALRVVDPVEARLRESAARGPAGGEIVGQPGECCLLEHLLHPLTLTNSVDNGKLLLGRGGMSQDPAP